MENQTSHTSQTPTSSPLSRRNFVGAAGLAGMGLLAANAAHGQSSNAATASKTDGLFAVPKTSKGEYALPPLPYAYDALEPHIDAETMRLHHDIHFEGYRTGLNKAIAQMTQFRADIDFPQISYWENQLAFNGAGYNLHTVFFQNMAPAGTTQPSAALEKVLANAFGSRKAFQEQFSIASKAVQGSGWGILGYQPFGKRLVVLQAEKHQNLTQWAVIPILALDVWEHAYYLKYQNKRGDYITNWWKVVNWDNVEQRIDAAMQLS